MTLAASYSSVRTRRSPHFEMPPVKSPPGDQAQIGADVSRSADARRIVDRSDKGERGQLAYAWDGHQPAASRRSSCHAPHVGVDCSDRGHHGSPRRNQTPHGGRETRDPFAGFESLVDEGGGERAGQSDPEYDRQTTDLVFQGHPLANQFLARDDQRA